MKRLLLAAIIALMSTGIGCARSGSGDGGAAAPVPPPVPAPSPDSRPPTETPPESRYNWTDGSTVDFFVDSTRVMEKYVGRPVNFPNADEGIILKMNLYMEKNTDTGSYSGRIKLAYEENDAQNHPVYHEAHFDSGYREQDITFNRFVTVNGLNHFKAFMQDDIGGIIIVIDKIVNNVGEGAIYFKNFDPSYAAKPWQFGGQHCWNILKGPYDCRDYLVGSGDDDKKTVNISSSVYPTRTKNGGYYYTRLGEFSGLDMTRALKD